MRRSLVYVVAGLAAALAACAEEGDRNVTMPKRPFAPSNAPTHPKEKPSGFVVHNRIGNPLDDMMRGEGPGLVVLGGGAEVDDAYVWMRTTIGGTRRSAGDVVVLRVTDDDTYAEYVYAHGAFNSVQTIVVPQDATAENLDEAAAIVDRAEGIIFASDDASAFLRWRDSTLAMAVQRAFDRGGVIAGTGGGASVFGQFAHDTRAAATAVQTPDALANPYEKTIAFARDTFRLPQLEGLIIDTHFRENDRFGRLAAFMARQVADGTLATHPPRVFGIGVDEGNAVVIDRFARASLVQADTAGGGAYIITGGTPEQIMPDAPLIYRNLVVARLDAPGEMFDLDRACGTAFVYPVSVTGGGGRAYTPADPYEAPGIAHDCPL